METFGEHLNKQRGAGTQDIARMGKRVAKPRPHTLVEEDLGGVREAVRELDYKVEALDTKIDTKVDNAVATLDTKIDTKVDNAVRDVDHQDRHRGGGR